MESSFDTLTQELVLRLSAEEAEAIGEVLDLVEKLGTVSNKSWSELSNLIRSEISTQSSMRSAGFYDIKNVDCTQAAYANRTFAENPSKIPQHYGDYNTPSVGDLYAFDPRPEAPNKTSDVSTKSFDVARREPFIDE